MEKVCEKFKRTVSIVPESSLTLRYGWTQIEDVVLAGYDEYCRMLQGPPSQRMTQEEFLKAFNKKHHMDISRPTLHNYFNKIERLGLHPLSWTQLKKEAREAPRPSALVNLEEYKPIYECFLKHLHALQKDNLNVYREQVYPFVAEELHIKASAVKNKVTAYRKHLESQSKEK